MINNDVKQEILRRLAAAEKEHNVTILYACESGSRAWGFPSPDSDYDVRFIYVHQQDWYLTYDDHGKRDVIEYPIVDEIDCNGWDLRKALQLFSRTNGALLEWLNSPIRYIETGSVAEQLRNYAPKVFNPKALCYHYAHMAGGNATQFLLKDRVRIKKYFYILRPLLAIRYIEAGLGLPPVRFEDLVSAVAPSDIKPSIAKLLELKSQTKELGYGEPVGEINLFIEMELHRLKHGFSEPDWSGRNKKRLVQKNLNNLFRSEVYANTGNPSN